MSALTFTMKKRLDQRVDMSPLVCNLLVGLTPNEIAGIELQNGKRKIRVDELFRIKGDDTQNIVIEGSFAKLDFIGKLNFEKAIELRDLIEEMEKHLKEKKQL